MTEHPAPSPTQSPDGATQGPAEDSTPPRVVVLVLVGGADSLAPVGGPRTPLAEAETPTLDRVARDGSLARLTLDEASCWGGFVALLGVDPAVCSLAAAEARGAGVDVASGSTVARADFVTVAADRMLDPTGGRVRDAEADVLLADVRREFGERGEITRLTRERNLLVTPSQLAAPPAPWQVLARGLQAVLPSAGAARDLFELSVRVLEPHDVNAVRVDLGENPANAIWVHGAGPALPERLTAPSWAPPGETVLVADGDAEGGVAAALGWDFVRAAADEDGVGAAALAALSEHRVVIVRTDLALRAGLRSGEVAGGAEARRDAFSELDARVAAPLLSALEESGAYAFAVVADGVFDAATRTYSAEPVPAGVLTPGGAPHGPPAFNERTCDESGHRETGGTGFAKLLAH